MTDEEYVIILKNCASMLADGIKYLKEEHQKQLKEAYERAIEVLSAKPQEWISVKDRLPSESDVYWVTVVDTLFGRKLVHAFAYDTNSKQWANGHLLNNERVVAWMKREVPSPYKGE